MEPQRLPNGDIRAPMMARGPGGAVGTGVVVLKPGDPQYAEHDAYLKRQGR